MLVGARLPALRRHDHAQRAALQVAGWRALVLDRHVAVLDPSRVLDVLGWAVVAAGNAVAVGP